MSEKGLIQTLRGPKLNGIAAFDLFATLIFSFILSGLFKYLDRFEGYTHVFVIFILLLIIAIGIHYFMEIPTMLNHYLGLNTLEEVQTARKERGEEE